MLHKALSNFLSSLALAQCIGAISVSLQGQRTREPIDVAYFLRLTRGESEHTFAIDLSSSNLWMSPSADDDDAGSKQTIRYSRDVTLTGVRKNADFTLGGHILENLSFIEGTSNPPHNLDGLIGLGPSPHPHSSSFIDDFFASDINVNKPRIVTLNLERPDYHSGRFDGILSLGQTSGNHSSILAQPRLEAQLVSLSDETHFQVSLGRRGILIGEEGVDDRSELLTAVFSARRLISRVPKYVADSIYGGVFGAQLRYLPGIGGAWVVPCRVATNIVVDFGGQLYPVHPLDASLDLSSLGYSSNDTIAGAMCLGTFQPTTTTGYVEFGTTFLHNVYLLISHGNSPYLQLLSTANPSRFLSDFSAARKVAFSRRSPQNSDDKPSKRIGGKPPYAGLKRPIGYAIVIGAVAGTIALLVITAVSCHCVRKYRVNKKTDVSKSGGGGSKSGGAYARLSDPESTDRPIVLSTYNPDLPYATETFTPPRAHRSSSGHFHDLPYETTPWSPPRADR